jgi:hypothetical protein
VIGTALLQVLQKLGEFTGNSELAEFRRHGDGNSYWWLLMSWFGDALRESASLNDVATDQCAVV